jgi:hypothetical protein
MSFRTTLLLVLAVAGWNCAAAAAPQTLRLDFFHGSHRAAEIFSLDEVVLEALPWSGNMRQPLDTTMRGKYLFEVIDDATGKVTWSRSFSSIYGEWETTAEASSIDRTFHESLRLPRPAAAFHVVIRKRDAANEFREVWRIAIDPDDYMQRREPARYRDQVVAIINHGDPAQKVDLLLLGDGYTAAEHDAFIARARELTDILFATSPFRERKADFNVWALAPHAAESGISRPLNNTWHDSPLGATYDAFRSERYVLTFDNKAWRRVASSTPYDFVEILTNSDVYGGGGIYGLFSTAAANSDWAPYLLVHEFAHHFAGLADEYYTSANVYQGPAEIVEPYQPNVTAMLDPQHLKWQQLVTPNTPIPTPWPKQEFEEHSLAVQVTRAQLRTDNAPEAEMNALLHHTEDYAAQLFATNPYAGAIGAFEGANFESKGYYRPAQNCVMFTRTDKFCAVCAAAIEQVIDEYTRPPD